AKLVPTVPESADRKQPDTTLVYHMHGTASPYSTAVFREVLDRPLASDEEWHWAILQAKGLPPAPPPMPDQASTTSGPAPAGTPLSDKSVAPEPSKPSVLPVSATQSPKN